LFIGLSADFAVQFSLRYRAQQYLSSDLREALLEAAERGGRAADACRCGGRHRLFVVRADGNIPVWRNWEKLPDAG